MLVVFSQIEKPLCPVCRTPIESHEAEQCEICQDLYHRADLKIVGSKRMCIFCRQSLYQDPYT